MKILQTCARFYPYIGGVETVVYESAKELVKRGHEVTVICADEPSVGSESIDGINVIRLPYSCKVANSNISPSLYNEIIKQDFDLIHTHLPHPFFADLSVWAAKYKKKPLFLTYHNDTIGIGIYSCLAQLYNHTAFKVLMSCAEKVFYTNPEYLERSKCLQGYKNKLAYAPLGVNRETFFCDPLIKKEKQSIFFLSVLDKYHYYKGLDDLIEAVDMLKESIPELKLYVGGEGELKPHYQKMVKSKELQDKVEFLGKLSDEDIVKFYNKASLFVLPSKKSNREGFGLVPLEAMSCGTPVIVSDVPAIAKKIRESNAGVVFESENIKDLSAGLLQILRDDELSEKYLNKGFELLETCFSWSRHVDILEKEYFKKAC